jgi:uncharacterized protein YndB with AHSA1/START domain
MENEPFIIERTFDAPPEVVWKAITDKDDMKQWYFDLPEFESEVGFEFRFAAGPPDGKQYLHICEVTETVPAEKLTYSWRYDGYDGISYVTFEIFPDGDKTRLKLTHSGLESFPADNPDFAKENFVAGWTDIIGRSLKDFLQRQP